MADNYGFTFSFSRRKQSKRERGKRVFRNRQQAKKYLKPARRSAKAYGISNIRIVKATKKEYERR